MIENIALVYFSPTDTTRRTVRAMAAGTGLPLLKEYDCTLPGARAEAAPAFGPETLVLVGGPVYGGRMPALWGAWLEGLQGRNTPAAIVPVYGNRHYDDAAVELYDTLTARGFSVYGAAMFIGEHSFSAKVAAGRPNAADLEEAKAFGAALAKKIAAGAAPLTADQVPGSRPMKPLGPPKNTKPLIDDKCVNCYTCADHCPSGAIDREDHTRIDASKCIMCRACAKLCPVAAIEFETAPAMAERCQQNFGSPDKANVTIL